MSRKTKYFKTTTLAEQQRRQDNAMDRLMGCVPMNGKELRALEFASVLDLKLCESGDALRERLQEIPNGWRQWRLVTTTLNKLLQQLYDVIPMKNLRHMQNLMAFGEVLIRMNAPVHTPEYTLLREDDLKELMNTAIRHECGLCLKEGREIDRCPLRRAMWNIAPPMKEHPISCEYSLIAMAMNAGTYKE